MEIIRTVRQQIYFQHTISTEELNDIPSYICNINQIHQTTSALPVYVYFPWILDSPKR